MCNNSEQLPLEIMTTLDVIEGKWKIPLVYVLGRAPLRFNALRRALPGLNQNMLALTLRELEAEGVISRTVSTEAPLRAEYALTDRGRRLGSVFTAMYRWARGEEIVFGE